MNRLLLDHLINERKIQIAVFAQNNRDSKDPNTIIWRPLYLTKQNGKVDFRVREHRLRWFQFSASKKLLMKNDFDIDAVLSGPSREVRRAEAHWHVVCGNCTIKAKAKSPQDGLHLGKALSYARFV